MSATKSSLEFKSILFSYLDPDGNYLEHEMLQRGVLWGIGTYLESNPLDLDEKTKGLLFGYLHSFDPVKTGGNKSKTAKIFDLCNWNQKYFLLPMQQV